MPQVFGPLFRLERRAQIRGHDKGEDKLTWFQSSAKARRGFCSLCGSSLFWDPLFRDWIGIAMGAFDRATDTKLHVHIFVAEKGDYYEIADGVEQFQQVPQPAQ
jgi:hypothetical protein